MTKRDKIQVNIRMTPAAKKAALKLAKSQNRTLSATVETLILGAAKAAKQT